MLLKRIGNIPNGGISGRYLYRKSNKILEKVTKLSQGKIQIIGLGGIEDGRTAYKKIKLGASTIQLYSGLVFKGPDLIEDILSELYNIKKLKNDPSKSFKILSSFKVVDKYEAFIIDIWGVLWDGVEPYQNDQGLLKNLLL